MTTDSQMLAALADPATYPHRPESVERVSTHTAELFLAGDRVYKIKKPVKFPFLDFSRLEARRIDCEAELRLNRRLADGVYRGVVPVRRQAGGRIGFGGEGAILEWAVEMDRLPDSRMLDYLVAAGGPSREEMAAVATLLHRFYGSLTPETGDGHLYLQHLDTEQEVNRRVLLRPDFGLERAEEAVGLVDVGMARVRPEIEARIAAGGIVEGHGDLRPEHLCLTDPPVIFDCLEFDRSMRLLDPYDEVNYLGMECAMHGAEWVRPFLIERLTALLQAPPSDALMAFYSTFRAVLRARLSIAHLLDEHPSRQEHWHAQTRRYLDMAIAEAGRA